MMNFTGKRQRYRIIDHGRLLDCLMHRGDCEGFSRWYELTLESHLGKYCPAREPVWTESLAVGGRHWLEKLMVGVSGAEIKHMPGQGYHVREAVETYALVGPARTRQIFWEKQQQKS